MSPAILIVDGQVAVRQIIQQSLHKTGYKTASTDNANKALELLDSYEFDGIIIDDELVGISGGKLCRQIKEQTTTRHSPVIVTSKSLRITNPEYVKATGADLALLKPIAAEKIVKALKSLLNPSRANFNKV